MPQDDNAHMMSDEHDPVASASSTPLSPSSNSDSDMDTVSIDTATGASRRTIDTSMRKPSPVPSPVRRTSARTAVGPQQQQQQSQQTAASVHQSAKMVDAQNYFQRVVKQELHVLLERGVEREVAVKRLLHRIVESTQEPEPSDVRRVMKQFQMNYDDAVRALIVKQEIGRLKRQGMDAFAAIEELTRKMQRVLLASASSSSSSPSASLQSVAAVRTTKKRRPSRELRSDGRNASDSSQRTERGVDASADGVAAVDDGNDDSSSSDDDTVRQHDAASSSRQRGDVDTTATVATATVPADQRDELTQTHVDADVDIVVAPSAATACDDVVAIDEPTSSQVTGDETTVAAAAADDGATAASASPSPLSLCQRIGNVTISSARTSGSDSDAPANVSAATGSDDDDSASHSALLAGLQSPQSRSATAVSSSSVSSPALVSRKRRGVFAPLFPSAKKQKLESYVAIARKGVKPAASPAASRSTSPAPTSAPSSPLLQSSQSQSSVPPSRTISVNPHKRPREIAMPSSGRDALVLDDDALSAHLIRLTKRQRSHAPTVSVEAATTPSTASSSPH